MIRIKEPHTHKRASGSVTIIEEVSQSCSEGSGCVFAPGRFGLRRFGLGRFAPEFLDRTLRPLTFWTWPFNPLTFWTRTFHPLIFWTWTFRPPSFLDQEVPPPDFLDLDVSPSNCFGPGRFAPGRFGPGRFAP